MSTIPDMLQIINYYLYGEDKKPENLLDENIVNRDKDTPIEINVNAQEFMKFGAGRYVDVGNFKAVRKFLAGEYADKFEKGKSYSTEEFWRTLGYDGYPENINTIVGVSNYGLDTSSSDYIDRAYVFGSMQFKINKEANFIVGEDGTFSIKNIAVVPVDDNFNYESSDGVASLTNGLTKDVIDPYGIGRKGLCCIKILKIELS